LPDFTPANLQQLFSDSLIEKADKWENYLFKPKDLIESREDLLKKPWKVEHKIWKLYDGSKLPIGNPMFEKRINYFISSLICIISIFGCVSGILAIIVI